MTFVPSNLNNYNYPIISEEAKKFWGSKHICNQMKARIAFSKDLDNANEMLKRDGYTRAFREKAIRAFGEYVHKPSMEGIPFSSMNDLYWECMPNDETPAPVIPHCSLYVPNFEGRKEQTMDFEETLNPVVPLVVAEFKTILTHPSPNQTVCLVSEESLGAVINLEYRDLQTRPYLQHSTQYVVYLDDEQWHRGTMLPHKFEGRIVKMTVRVGAGIPFKDTWHWGGDAHGQYYSTATFLDSLVLIDNNGSKYRWDTDCWEEEPPTDDIDGIDGSGANIAPLTFNNINGWKKL